MKKIFLTLVILLFVFGCSSDFSQKPAPGCIDVTAQDVR